MKKKILIVVDPQKDFTSSIGALSIANADAAYDNINKLLEDPRFNLKVVTQDWHPENHISFAKTNGATLFTTKETLQNSGKGNKTITQMMWPNHCVAGTEGAQFDPAIRTELADMIWRKGSNPLCEQYSAFEYADGEFTELCDLLIMGQRLNDLEFYIAGYAADYCCAETALGIRRFLQTIFDDDDDDMESMPKVYFLENAMAWVDPNNRAATIEKLEKEKITISCMGDFEI